MEYTDKSSDEAALSSLGERTLDQLTVAIEAGETEKARELAAGMHAEFQGMHDLFLNWTTGLLSFIGKNYGDEALATASAETVQYYNDAVWDDTLASAFAAMSDEERIQALASGLRGHLQSFDVTEKDDCYEILLEHCGSGGRLVQQGAYEGPNALYKVKTPSAMTFGQKDFPVYCTHCHFQNHFIPNGSDIPLAEIIPSLDVGRRPCVVRLAKREAK